MNTKQRSENRLIKLLDMFGRVGVSLSYLSNESGLSKGYVSRLMRGLWQAGFVRRAEYRYRSNASYVEYYLLSDNNPDNALTYSEMVEINNG